MPEGEVMIADFGLALGVTRPGEGEGEALSKGLLRHRALVGPVVDMLPNLFYTVFRFNSAMPSRHYKEMNPAPVF